MKYPKHMTMKELLALPLVDDFAALLAGTDPEDAGRCYGGAFEDDDGYVWGTFRLDTGWVRYPAYLALLGPQAPARASYGAWDRPEPAHVPQAHVAHRAMRPKLGLVGAIRRCFGGIVAQPSAASRA